MQTHTRIITLVAAFAAASLAARADTVVTKNGDHLTGTVTKIDGTAVSLVTDYAGTLTIKQSDVASVQIDKPTFVRLQDGTVVQGTVAPAPAAGGDSVEVKGTAAAVTTPVQKIAATWAPGATDPAVLALQHKWTYEATADVTGATGNSEQLGTAAGFRAVNTGPSDKLQLYTDYNRQRSDGVVSADKFDAGIDYANNFSGRSSWFLRDEAGYDRVNDISFYDTAAGGYGYDFIKQALHLLTGRVGLSYRYDEYKSPTTPTVNDVGLDFELHHEWTFKNSKLVNDLVYLPSLQDSSIYEITHQSYYEIPLADPRWKMRMGVANDYNSEPGAGFKRLNTTYFLRLVLDWE